MNPIYFQEVEKVITFIIVIHVVISLMLIVMVLIQSGKGTGFADVFGMGGGMGQSLFGVQTGTFLTRLTTVLAILFMITSLSLAIFMGYSRRSVVDKIGKEGGWEKTEPVEKVELGLPGEKSEQEGQEERTREHGEMQSPSEENSQD